MFKALWTLTLYGLLLALAGCEDEEPMRAGLQPPPPPPRGAPAAGKTYDYTQKPVSAPARVQGRKWTVAILRFGDEKGVEGVPWGAETQPAKTGSQVNVEVTIGNKTSAEPSQTPPMMNKRARETLKHQLIQSDAFTVVERERILEILREVNFGKGPYADPATAPDQGKMLCVRYLIEGSMGFNEDATLKGNLDKEDDYKDIASREPGLRENIYDRNGRPNREKMAIAIRKAQEERRNNEARRLGCVACYLSAYDVHTGEVATTVMGLGANGLEAINEAVGDLIDALAKVQGDIYVSAVSGQKVYLDVGSHGDIKPGTRLTVVHHGKPVRDRDGGVIGYDDTEVGQIEVTEVQSAMCVAKVVSQTTPLARGDIAKTAK